VLSKFPKDFQVILVGTIDLFLKEQEEEGGGMQMPPFMINGAKAVDAVMIGVAMPGFPRYMIPRDLYKSLESRQILDLQAMSNEEKCIAMMAFM